jgi:hypothetical protein
MANVYFVKDGTGNHTDRGRNVPVDLVRASLAEHANTYTRNGPAINPRQGQAKVTAPYKYVVVEIDTEETCRPFPHAGYYHIHDLSPQQCQALLDLE